MEVSYDEFPAYPYYEIVIDLFKKFKKFNQTVNNKKKIRDPFIKAIERIYDAYQRHLSLHYSDLSAFKSHISTINHSIRKERERAEAIKELEREKFKNEIAELLHAIEEEDKLLCKDVRID